MSLLDLARSLAVVPGVLGINGPQGCGKSTLARALVAQMDRAVALSIDDFYLTRAEQQALADRSPGDPLLAVRGGPGTHDVQLGVDVLDALRGTSGQVRVPTYDKAAYGGLGDRGPWRTVDLPVDLVILEGWMLGFAPAGGAVDDRLPPYAAWTSRLDALLQLRVADPQQIVRWRVDAEARMDRPGMSPEAARAYVERFLPLYAVYPEALARSPPRRHRVVWLGADRQPLRG